MPTHATDGRGQGLGAAAKSVSEHLSSIFRLELELATMEIKRKVVSLGLGIGFAVGAAIFLLFVVAFGMATIAAAIATTLSIWLALLIMTGGCFAIAALLGVLALMKIRKGSPPVP